MKRKTTLIRIAMIFAGVLALLAGTFVYLTDRPPQDTYFVNQLLRGVSLHGTLPPVFGKLGNVLPDFIHPFSFSLITAGLIASTIRGCLIICVFWFAVNSAFELGQHFKSFSTALIPGWFENIAGLENCESFFLNGNFDPFDILAIFLGSLLAFFLSAAFLHKN